MNVLGIRLRIDRGVLTPDTPKGVMTADLVAQLKVGLLAALAHPNLPGVSPELVARLSAEDLADTAAGDIPVKTVQAFEQAAAPRRQRSLDDSEIKRCVEETFAWGEPFTSIRGHQRPRRGRTTGTTTSSRT